MPQGVVFRQGKRWENQSSSDNKRSVSVYKLTSCIDCATGCCLQARKEMGKSTKFRQQEVSKCVQTYPLHRLCTECCLQARKEMENQPNSDNKRSVSVYKLTGCIDCVQNVVCRQGKRWKINQIQTTRGQ